MPARRPALAAAWIVEKTPEPTRPFQKRTKCPSQCAIERRRSRKRANGLFPRRGVHTTTNRFRTVSRHRSTSSPWSAFSKTHVGSSVPIRAQSHTIVRMEILRCRGAGDAPDRLARRRPPCALLEQLTQSYPFAIRSPMRMPARIGAHDVAMRIVAETSSFLMSGSAPEIAASSEADKQEATARYAQAQCAGRLVANALTARRLFVPSRTGWASANKRSAGLRQRHAARVR